MIFTMTIPRVVRASRCCCNKDDDYVNDDNDANDVDDVNDNNDDVNDDDTIHRTGLCWRGGPEDAAVLFVRRHSEHRLQNGIERRR